MEAFLRTPSLLRAFMAIVCLLLFISPVTGCTPGAPTVSGPASPTPMAAGNTLAAHEVTPAEIRPTQETPLPTKTSPPVASPTSPAPVMKPALSDFVQVDFRQPRTQFIVKETKELPPSEVLREVSYSGGFGGMGEGCYHPENSPSVPTIFLEKENPRFEWEEPIDLEVCGWLPDEKILFQVTSADGKVIYEEQMQARENGGIWWINYVPELNTPPGEYQLSFTGQQKKVEKQIVVDVPAEPRFYWKNKQLILYNFQPEEEVQLYVYWSTGVNQGNRIATPCDWKTYKADRAGQLIVDVDDKIITDVFAQAFYVVLGKTSGEVHPFPKNLGGLKQNIFSKLGFTIAPTDSDIEGKFQKIKNIWDLVKYRELYNPGKNTYSLTIQPTDVLRWRYTWCAADQNTLDNNKKNMAIEFWTDGEKVDNELIHETEFDSVNTWKCRRLGILLYNWTPGKNHTLEIRYKIASKMTDGASTFTAGDYLQRINLEVK